MLLHHCRYLSALISQSFLDIGSVSRILGSIMTLCLQFCWTLENQESSQNTCELERITEVSKSAIAYLLFVGSISKPRKNILND